MTTLIDNPDLAADGAGPNLKSYQDAGIRGMYDQWENGKFKTFDATRNQYNTPAKDFFYKYFHVKTIINILELSDNAHTLKRLFWAARIADMLRW